MARLHFFIAPIGNVLRSSSCVLERTKSRWSLPPLLHFESIRFSSIDSRVTLLEIQQRDLATSSTDEESKNSFSKTYFFFLSFLFSSCSRCNFLYLLQQSVDKTEVSKQRKRSKFLVVDSSNGRTGARARIRAIIDKLFEDGRAPVMRAFFRQKKQLLRVNLGRLTSSKNRRFLVTLVTLTRAECVSLLLLIFHFYFHRPRRVVGKCSRCRSIWLTLFYRLVRERAAINVSPTRICCADKHRTSPVKKKRLVAKRYFALRSSTACRDLTGVRRIKRAAVFRI